MLVVDAVVDDGDLDSVALRARQSRELGRADDGRTSVQERGVRVARIHLVRDSEAQELRQLRVRDADHESVQEHAIPPRDLGLRQRRAQARDRPVLGRVDAGEVRAGERARQVELPPCADGGERVTRCGGGERCVLERDDDASPGCGVSVRARGDGLSPVQARLCALDDAPRIGTERARGCSGGGDEES